MSLLWQALVIALWVTVLLVGVALLGIARYVLPLLRQIAPVMAQLQVDPPGLQATSQVPAFEVADIEGRRFDSDDLRGRVLLFLSGGCAPCRVIASQLSSLREEVSKVVIAVARRTDAERLELVGSGVRVLDGQGDMLSDLFATTSTPHAFGVASDGTILFNGFPNTIGEVVQMLEELRSRDASPAEDREPAIPIAT